MKSRKERFNQLQKKGMNNLTIEELKEVRALNKYFYNGKKKNVKSKNRVKEKNI